MRTKRDLDAKASALLGMPRSVVSTTTAAFLHLLGQELGRGHRVFLPGFGSLIVKEYKHENRRQFHLTVKKSAKLKALLERFAAQQGDVMEKLGVDEGQDQEGKEKAASEGCPKCGSKKVGQHGRLLVCPNCGTEPFEKHNRK